METLGSLLDKFSIAKIRLEKFKADKAGADKIEILDQQNKGLMEEIDSYLSQAISGDIKTQDPKLKMYKHEENIKTHLPKMSDAIAKLFHANYTLWNLEDQRRDKNISNANRLEVCDQVATYNKIRNYCIDEINRILTKSIQRKK